MGILMKMGKSRAIKKIARNLPPHLTSGYGISETYTPGQVGAAMEETGCNSEFIDYAYAMFCDETTFSEISSSHYETLHTEIAELCFDGNTNFNTNDICSYSDGGSSGDFSGGDGGSY